MDPELQHVYVLLNEKLHLNGNDSRDLKTDEQLLKEYEEKIMEVSNEPLLTDVVDWINKILNIDTLTKENIFINLESGEILMKLGSKVEEAAANVGATIKKINPLMKIPGRKQNIFHARERISEFLNFCRSLDISDTILFETSDLTNHYKHQEKIILLTLMELSRVASKRFKLEPTEIVKTEEIIEKKQSLSNILDETFYNPVEEEIEETLCKSDSELDLPTASQSPECISPLSLDSKEDYEDDKQEKRLNSSRLSSKKSLIPRMIPKSSSAKSRISSPTLSSSDTFKTSRIPLIQKKSNITLKMYSECHQTKSKLDMKIEEAVMERACDCVTCMENPIDIIKLDDNIFKINGKIYSIQLQKDHTPLVRVGGGYEKLEVFLTKYKICRRSLIKTIINGADNKCQSTPSKINRSQGILQNPNVLKRRCTE